jgi:hypothetical protein
MVVSPFWSRVEPNWDGGAGDDEPACPRSFYSKRLKADLLPGTFVLFSSKDGATTDGPSPCSHYDGCGVGRIVCVVTHEDRDSRQQPPPQHTRVRVNIFKRFTEFAATTASILRPEFINDNHLRHLPEVVQTEEMQLITSSDIMNLAFVFTPTALKDSCNLFFTCQGMAIAFIVRSRYQEQVGLELPMLTEVPPDHCLPFPSSYIGSGYYDCYPRRMWNSVMCLKLELTKLLGRYSHLQGLYCKEACRLSNFTPETWGFLRWQFHDIFEDADCGMSTRIRRHRLTEAGLVVKAVRVIKRCTVLRFETKAHLRRLCGVLGESATAGQRCRLPKISTPKNLWQNDIINVVCGADTAKAGAFSIRTVHDGIDLEYDGCSELFLTVRYRRFTYSANSISMPADCDPLLFALICRHDPYVDTANSIQNDTLPVADEDADDDDAAMVIADGSEFEDCDGCLYRVVHGMATSVGSSTFIQSRCVYPQSNNPLFGMEKSFDVQIAKDLIERRLNG